MPAVPRPAPRPTASARPVARRRARPRSPGRLALGIVPLLLFASLPLVAPGVAGEVSAAALRLPFLASALGTPLSGGAPLTVRLSAALTGGLGPFGYAWSVGGQTFSHRASATHVFDVAGDYEVHLRVSDLLGRLATGSLVIVVGAAKAGVLGTGGRIATTPSTFWSIDAQTACASCLATNPAVESYLDSTPFHWVRYGAGTDACDLATDTSYSDAGAASPGCAYNVSALKSWCDATSPHCGAILSLPGENNNSAEDAAIARYIVDTLGFQPAYWSIGNEPTGWTHYGLPWTAWRTTDDVRATPIAYAFDVKAAIAAVRAVDPGARFIGIEAACSCNSAWFTDVARVDGAQLSAVAYHLYPSEGLAAPTLAEFYAPLEGPGNISSSYASVEHDVALGCARCASLPIFINEYNAGPGWAPSSRAGSYANAVFEAASVTEALRANVTQFTFFNLQTASATYGFSLLGPGATRSPVGTLFEQMLPSLAIGEVRESSIATSIGGVYEVLTANATATTLLVVNTNTSHALGLSLLGAPILAGVGTSWSWRPGAAAPVRTHGRLASAYEVPAQGLLLLSVP